MGPTIIARNYAETLLALAHRHGGTATVDAYARALEDVAELMRRDARIREFLETPRLDADTKKRALRAALAGRVPEHFLRFLLVVVEKRRQALLPHIEEEYQALVDQVHGRVRAEVTLVAEPDAETRRELITSLERKLGRQVVASFRADPSLIGGVIVRIGDLVADGSIRRRMADLRRRLVSVRLPQGV